MLLAQKFALDNIYCAPSQDKQFCFRMTRVNKPYLPPKGFIVVHNATKHLPNTTSNFHVFSVGGIPPQILNLLSQQESWFRDSWVKVSDDMVARTFLMKVYNDDGLLYPRKHLYYSFTDQNSLLVALEVTENLRTQFTPESFKFLHVYSNSYFQTTEYNTRPDKLGIRYMCGVANNNTEKVVFQSFAATQQLSGGKCFVYVNGFFVPSVTLSIANGCLIEVVYDQSVRTTEAYSMSSLRTFQSTLDSKTKYLLYRQDNQDYIQYQDDTELYVVDTAAVANKGLYFYKHSADVMRNVTDKDYSLNASYLNNTSIRLGELTTPGLATKQVVIYSRHAGKQMHLVYSALKLHELYKLPSVVQKDVISNTGYTLDIYRAEQLEASSYFAVASASSMAGLTPELCTAALGYASLANYYAQTPQVVTSNTTTVAELYQLDSMAFEYNISGLYTGRYVTNGPVFTRSNSSVAYVEFMKGFIPPNFGRLYTPVDNITLSSPTEEVVVLSAYFNNEVKQSSWEDITLTSKVVRSGATLNWSEELGKKVKLVRMSTLNIYDLDVSLSEGIIYFPITSIEDRGTGMQNFICDVPYQDVSLYLNGSYLTEGIDYTLDFPYVCIYSKKYINYALATQQLHIRCSGFTLDKTKVNHLNINGFVNNGVLTRNKYYDLRDDRVYSVFVGGKLYDKSVVSFSEQDNTVRTSNGFNGLPYTVRENFIPLRMLSGQDSRTLYNANNAVNKKISELFNVAFPEPTIDPFNVIAQQHTLFSPVTSKIINDILTGVIPANVYSTPYNDNTILSLLENSYKDLLKLDPVKKVYPSTIVVIHPHLGNGVIGLNLFQYRFLQNVIRIITNNDPVKINLSGHISLTS